MKKSLLTLTLLLCAVLIRAEVRPYPFPTEVLQPDGTTVTVTMNGDADFCWLTLGDGTIVVNTGRGYYVAALDSEGNLTVSGQLAHEQGTRTAAEQQIITRQKANRQRYFAAEEAKKEIRQRQRISISETTTPSYFPHTGTPKVLVILAAFKDSAFCVTDPKASFDQYLNGDEQTEMGWGEHYNYGSVRTYFSDMSFGDFTPQFDIVGPVTVSDTLGAYGYKKGNAKARTYVTEACKLVNDSVNFADYDSDGDGYVDLVYVIYPGYGCHMGAPTNTIWAHVGQLTSTLTLDGVKIKRYGVSNELNRTAAYWAKYATTPKIAGIGVFCHEFSHALGLPDLYPTSTSAQVDNQEMEYWDVMDGGFYNYHSYRPCAYSAWERETMGWMTVDTLSDDVQGLEMLPIDNGGKAYRMLNPDSETGREYMMLENIQKTGWNGNAYGHGLLVTHVDYANETVNSSDLPNNTKGHPRVAVVPADSLVISYYQVKAGNHTSAEYTASHAGDPFPGTSAITELNDSMALPNWLFYATNDSLSGKVNQALANIAEDSTGIVTFDYINYNKTVTGIVSVQTPAAARKDDNIYDLQGRRVAVPGRGIYIRGGRKYVVK